MSVLVAVGLIPPFFTLCFGSRPSWRCQVSLRCHTGHDEGAQRATHGLMRLKLRLNIEASQRQLAYWRSIPRPFASGPSEASVSRSPTTCSTRGQETAGEGLGLDQRQLPAPGLPPRGPSRRLLSPLLILRNHARLRVITQNSCYLNVRFRDLVLFSISHWRVRAPWAWARCYRAQSSPLEPDIARLSSDRNLANLN